MLVEDALHCGGVCGYVAGCSGMAVRVRCFSNKPMERKLPCVNRITIWALPFEIAQHLLHGSWQSMPARVLFIELPRSFGGGGMPDRDKKEAEEEKKGQRRESEWE